MYTSEHVWRDARMNAGDFITTVRRNLGEPELSTVKDAVLALHGHGVADDVTGDVEAPTGHVILADRWIVLTNSQGFTTLEDFDSAETARERFAAYEDAYADWQEEGGDA
jgi:hypothetical protein